MHQTLSPEPPEGGQKSQEAPRGSKEPEATKGGTGTLRFSEPWMSIWDPKKIPNGDKMPLKGDPKHDRVKGAKMEPKFN